MKRLMDVVIALCGLAVLSPLLGAIALAIAVMAGRPVLFRQARPGWRGRPFVIAKFRTMREPSDADGSSPSDSERLFPLGRLLRTTSLDELPGLWNVLVGDMSLVGPRPLLMEYLPLYTPTQARRHEVRPGLTGWAQVHGRNALSWESKFDLDVWYVDHQSIRLDVRILCLTAAQVVLRRGISAPGEATMSKFTGSAS